MLETISTKRELLSKTEELITVTLATTCSEQPHSGAHTSKCQLTIIRWQCVWHWSKSQEAWKLLRQTLTSISSRTPV